MTLFFGLIRPATALKLRLGITVLRSTFNEESYGSRQAYPRRPGASRHPVQIRSFSGLATIDCPLQMVAVTELRTCCLRHEQRSELAVDGRARDAARGTGRGRGRSVADDAGNGLLLDHGNGQAHRPGGRAQLRGRADAAAL